MDDSAADNNTDSDVRHLVLSRVDGVAASMGRAFFNDPVLSWLFPPEDTRLGFVTAFMTMACSRAVELGHAYELGDGEGGAAWAPPDTVFYGEAQGVRMYELVTTCDAGRAELVFGGFEGVSDHHPDEPHFYLSNIGVDPERQGSGRGARLLERVLQICDTDGIPAHLESSNPRNVSLYERHGFTVVAEHQLPEGPVLRPMTRAPQ